MSEFTVSFIGSNDTFKMLGVHAPSTDLEFIHYTKAERTVTFIKPVSYPDKLRTLIQALELSDYVIIELSAVDKYLAETIVTIDLLKKKGLFIYSPNNQGLAYQLGSLTKGTVSESYEQRVINSNEDLVKLKQELLAMNPSVINASLTVIDQFFEVKSVGLVALGFLLGGELSAREQVILQPGGRDVQVKSIQCMDVDVKSVSAKARVGLALKNCQTDDLIKGSVLVREKLPELTELKGRITKMPFYKGELKSGSQVIVMNSLQSVTGTIMSEGEVNVISLQKPIVKVNDYFILIDTNSPGLRLIGSLKVLS